MEQTVNNNLIDIPKKTMSLINQIAQPKSIGIPVKTKIPEKHSVATRPRKEPPANKASPWGAAPPPTDEQADDMHLFRLSVNKDKKKSWKIEVTDLNTTITGIHCSGYKGVLSMDGQVKTGRELLNGNQPEYGTVDQNGNQPLSGTSDLSGNQPDG